MSTALAEPMMTLTIRPPGGEERVFRHRGSRADLGVVKQIFQNQDYSLDRLARGKELQALYLAMAAGNKTPLILDAGANIGASACWFALRYPRSRIVAFEPDAGNFELLRLNTQGLNVERHPAAIGSQDGRVTLTDPGRGEWAFRTMVDIAGPVELASVTRIVDQKIAEGLQPFIAKIDIEGGELDLFRMPDTWVDQFPVLIVELHDWLMPKQRTSQTFLKCVADRDRDFVHIGEHVFSIRN